MSPVTNQPTITPSPPPSRADEFFVGWLPMPAGHARFARRAACVGIVIVAAAAAVIPARQQSPGTGVWETDSIVTLQGVAVAWPYAMLLAPQDGGEMRTVLLVEAGKFAATERIRPFAGQPVRVSGTLLHRDDRSMLELVPGERAIEPRETLSVAPEPLRHATAARSLGAVALQGEIIDPKCYLGAMKPGGGKTHKACAALCLAGGIPPMFVTRDSQGRETFYLLTTPAGGPCHDRAIPFVGDPVELRGQLEQRGDLFVLKVDFAHVRRL